MHSPGDAEFGFELLVCRWAETDWPPDGARDDDTAVVVARQLGTKRRRWDTVVVETTPEALRRRARFGARELDSDLLHVVRNAPAEWTWYRDCLPDPGYPWRYVRAAVHRAAGRDLIAERRDGNRIEIKRVAPYPDWADRIVAVENKPDLDASAARALADQLTHDVDTALADEVWVATRATGEAVEPALLGDFPVEVGVLAMEFGDVDGADWPAYPTGRASVEWLPSALDPETDSEGMTTTEKAERRRVIAERAYGRGWRSYVDTMRPDCRHFEPRRPGGTGGTVVPGCDAKGRHQTAGECSGSCGEFEPEPPTWRTGGWPVDGGPAKGAKRLLERRRERVRAAERGRDRTDGRVESED
jgi:hypothetical protein